MTAFLAASPAAVAQSKGRLPEFGEKSDYSDFAIDIVLDGKGRINYDKGVIKATGYGAAPTGASSQSQAKIAAMTAARGDALRTLALTVSAVQVTAAAKVRDYANQSDRVKTRLDALLRSPHVASETIQPDGSAAVVVEIPMFGAKSLASVVLPGVMSATTPVTSVGGDIAPDKPDESAPPVKNLAGDSADFAGPAEPSTSVEAPSRTPRGIYRVAEPGPSPLSDNGPFTALIIDCRSLRLGAILSPKLMDTMGREIYGVVHVTPEYAIETGAVGYARSMSAALRSARAGSHPLIVKGLRVADRLRTSPVVLLEDADRILTANNRDHFLEQTRVIFVIDQAR